MALLSATDDSNCAHHSDNDDGDGDDRPPPIPPRPLFTFAAHRNRSSLPQSDNLPASQPVTDCNTAWQTHEDVAETGECLLTSGGLTTPRDDGAQTGECRATPGGVKTENGAGRPRHRSDKLRVVDAAGCDNSAMSSAAANDEVFASCEDSNTANDVPLASDSSVHQQQQQQCRSSASEHETGVSDMQPPPSVLSSSAASCSTDDVQAAVCDDGQPVSSEADTHTTSAGTGRTATDDAAVSSSELSVAATVAVARGGSDDKPLSQARSPNSLRAPLVSFSEFDDFGLDPDLFRECGDIPFSEKTAKFTRSASPLYETVADEDETGKTSQLN